MNRDTFTVRRADSAGCGILNPDGTIIASAADEPWALFIAGRLNLSGDGGAAQRVSAWQGRGDGAGAHPQVMLRVAQEASREIQEEHHDSDKEDE